MQVVIFAGGKGTRLGDISQTIPKPMIRIGDDPILLHIMKIYAKYGYKDFIICLGYLGNTIKEYFANYYLQSNDCKINYYTHNGFGIEYFDKDSHDITDWTITLVNTGLNAETGSRLKSIREYVKGDYFLYTYADGLANIDLHKLWQFHLSKDKLGTITGVHPPSRFGELSIVDQELVGSFQEKPQMTTNYINGGFGVLSTRVFDDMALDFNMSIEEGLLSNLSRRGELAVYKHDGFWMCVDTARELQLLNDLCTIDHKPWE